MVLLNHYCRNRKHSSCTSKDCECKCHLDGRYCRKGWCERCWHTEGRCPCPCHKKVRGDLGMALLPQQESK